MSTLEFLTYISIFVIMSGTYIFCFLYLGRMLKTLEDFIMAQKDITAFNQIHLKDKIVVRKDEKKEKEQENNIEFIKIINSGICDDTDIKRFGTVTVDQG